MFVVLVVKNESKVEQVVEDFEEFVEWVGEMPIEYDGIESINVDTDLDMNEKASAFYHNDFNLGIIKLSDELIEWPKSKKYLIILHECIHLKFFKILDRERNRKHLEGKIIKLRLTEERNLFNIQKYSLAKLFFDAAEDIIAEMELKKNYSHFFDERIRMLLELIKLNPTISRAKAIGIKKYAIFLMMLRTFSCIKLAEINIKTQYQSHHDDLDKQLKAICTTKEIDFFRVWEEKLSNISLEPHYFNDQDFLEFAEHVLSLQQSN